MQRNFTALTLFSLCLAATPFASFEEPVEVAVTPVTTDGFELDAGEHHLRDILVKAARYLNRNYILPEQELGAETNKVELQKKIVLDGIGCEEVVSQLAATKGFIIVPLDSSRGIYEVVSERGNRAREITNHAVHLTPAEILRKSKLKMMVVTTINLEHVNAQRAVQNMRPFFASRGGNGLTIGSSGQEHSILLMGYANQVAAALRVIRDIDVADRSPSIAPGQATGRAPKNQRMKSAPTANDIDELTTMITSLQKRVSALEAKVSENSK